MAKSRASKKRAHQLRNTGRNASEFRGEHVMIPMSGKQNQNKKNCI